MTDDQEKAIDALFAFIADPIEKAFVLSGYSGCGKSTLIREFMDRLDAYFKLGRILNNTEDYELVLTATTNKAAENLARITSQSVCTIHSFLNLSVSTDYKTQETTLVPRSNAKRDGYLIFIDEGSYIDSQLLKFIFELTHNCKIVFIGDPAQLTPVKSHGAPVFEAGFPSAHLYKVVRQAENNPIVDLSTKFRETVNTGQFFSFKPDGNHVLHLPKEAFLDEVLKEFSRPDWKFLDSKVLGWTNKCVIEYNRFIRNHLKGNPTLEAGDYAVVNNYISVNRRSLKTDQLVMISSITPSSHFGVPGHLVACDNYVVAFWPISLEAKNQRIAKARQNNETGIIQTIEEEWIDLRAAYACTINKAQGSTYDKVFIDLDDVRRCNSGDQIARMLYVAVSRARNQVVMTGDLA